MATEEGMRKKYTFSGSIYFDKMKELGLYTTDHADIANRVEKASDERVQLPTGRMRLPQHGTHDHSRVH
jgi:hypothetical protein